MDMLQTREKWSKIELYQRILADIALLKQMMGGYKTPIL